MSDEALEKRMVDLEKTVRGLQKLIANGTPQSDWRKLIGIYTGDGDVKRVLELAMQYRQKDRERSRKRSLKRRVK